MHTLRIVPVAVTMVAAATAQVPIVPLPTRGMMSSYPAGVIASPGGDIQKKPAGLPVTAFQPFNTSGPIAQNPRAAIMAWLAVRAGSAPVTQIAIDAFSSGNDTLPLLFNTSSGNYWVGKGMVSGWAVLCLTVHNMPQVGDAVVGYYFDNPAFPQQLRNGIYTEFLPSDFPGSSLPDELDIAMGLLDDNRGILEVGSHPETHRVYFSLTPTSAQTLYNELHAAPGDPLLEVASSVPYTFPPGTHYYTGATIFVAEFAPDFNNVVTCTGVYVREDWQSLGVEPSSDVDALAVASAVALSPTEGFELLTPGTLQYVFSLSAGSGFPELLVAANVGSTPSGTRKQGPLLSGHGDNIIGSGTFVTSACAKDPETAGMGGFGYAEPVVVGDPGPTHSLSLSLTAQTTSTAGPNDHFLLTGVVSGWGGYNPEASLYWLRMEMVGGQLDNFTFYLGPWSRAATDDYHVFQQAFDVPFTDLLGTLPVNRCRFSVYQAAVSLSHTTDSFRSLIFRSQ